MRKLLRNNFEEAQNLLNDLLGNDSFFETIELAGQLITQTIKTGNKVMSCGNGGSMCDAIHFAEELSGKFRNERIPLPAIAISDSAHITCVGNDYGFDFIFSRFIDAIGVKGDCLLVISTSGNSKNIIEAAKIAKQKGISVIALTGKDGGTLKDFAEVEIRVPFFGYSDRIQEIHIKVIHSLIHFVENNLEMQ